MGKKKKAGRPPLPKGQAMDERFWFRVSKAQAKLFSDAADAVDKDVGTWARDILIDAAKAALSED